MTIGSNVFRNRVNAIPQPSGMSRLKNTTEGLDTMIPDWADASVE
ncbi:MAG TPA: hypothetical protein VLU94_00820 [Candidatus Nitrosotalea sp.]|nr:hypothetical protein [Candidatus Nitrosotalea sp.]